MKVLHFITVIFLILSTVAANAGCAKNVPAVILQAFNKAHPGNEAAEWKQSGDSYIVMFTEENRAKSITYNSKAMIESLEEQVNLSELPTEIIAYINEQHPDGVIRKAILITKTGKKDFFRVTIKGLDLLFDSGGNYLSHSLEPQKRP